MPVHAKTHSSQVNETPVWQNIAALMPISVALIIFGDRRSPWAKEYILEEGIVTLDNMIDVRSWLQKDPASDPTVHGVDGDHASTQQVVFSNNAVVEVIKEVSWSVLRQLIRISDAIGAETMESCPNVWRTPSIGACATAIYCTAGCHRSSVVGKAVESMLNSIVNPDGTRVFEAQVFALSPAKNVKHAHAILERAHKWSYEAWTRMPTIGNRSMLYAAAACRGNPDASENHDAYKESVDKLQEWWDECVATKPESIESDDPDDEAEEVPDNSPSRAASDGRGTSILFWKRQSKKRKQAFVFTIRCIHNAIVDS